MERLNVEIAERQKEWENDDNVLAQLYDRHEKIVNAHPELIGTRVPNPKFWRRVHKLRGAGRTVHDEDAFTLTETGSHRVKKFGVLARTFKLGFKNLNSTLQTHFHAFVSNVLFIFRH